MLLFILKKKSRKFTLNFYCCKLCTYFECANATCFCNKIFQMQKTKLHRMDGASSASCPGSSQTITLPSTFQRLDISRKASFLYLPTFSNKCDILNSCKLPTFLQSRNAIDLKKRLESLEKEPTGLECNLVSASPGLRGWRTGELELFEANLGQSQV